MYSAVAEHSVQHLRSLSAFCDATTTQTNLVGVHTLVGRKNGIERYLRAWSVHHPSRCQRNMETPHPRCRCSSRGYKSTARLPKGSLVPSLILQKKRRSSRKRQCDAVSRLVADLVIPTGCLRKLKADSLANPGLVL